MPEKETTKPIGRYELVEVPTQYGLGYRDNTTEEILDQNQLTLRIANELSEIKKILIAA